MGGPGVLSGEHMGICLSPPKWVGPRVSGGHSALSSVGDWLLVLGVEHALVCVKGRLWSSGTFMVNPHCLASAGRPVKATLQSSTTLRFLQGGSKVYYMNTTQLRDAYLARGIQRENSKDSPSKGGLHKEQSA